MYILTICICIYVCYTLYNIYYLSLDVKRAASDSPPWSNLNIKTFFTNRIVKTHEDNSVSSLELKWKFCYWNLQEVNNLDTCILQALPTPPPLWPPGQALAIVLGVWTAHWRLKGVAEDCGSEKCLKMVVGKPTNMWGMHQILKKPAVVENMLLTLRTWLCYIWPKMVCCKACLATLQSMLG